MLKLKPITLTLIISSLLAATVVSAQTAPAAGTATPSRADSVLETVSLIIGEPNYSVDGAYQELEEGLYSRPELFTGNNLLAPIKEIIENLGGSVEIDSSSKSATYTLAGHRIQLQADQLEAHVDDQAAKTNIRPQWRNGSLWVSVNWVFTELGAWTKWDAARQRFSASLALPKDRKAEGFARGGKVVVSTLDKQDRDFWRSADGLTVAETIMGYQNEDGGWPKLDRDVSMMLPVNRAALSGFKAKSTIDNDATTRQLNALAAAYAFHHDDSLRDAIEKGLDYLLAAQLPNGGWQQFWPNPLGYKARITFNDNAIANVLEVLRDAASQKGDYGFVKGPQAQRARTAYEAGVALILKTQIKVAGKRTGWCAQYDENTLAPAMGRAFELASISGDESVDVVRFLMDIEKPSAEVIQSVQDAIAWFDAAKIAGIKRVRRNDPTLEFGFDFVMEPSSSPEGVVWARFYDLQNGKPLFSARDSVPRSRFEEVSYERRVKYNWYVTGAASLLKTDYPAWLKRNGLKSVLGRKG